MAHVVPQNGPCGPRVGPRKCAPWSQVSRPVGPGQRAVWRQAGDCLLVPSVPQGLPSAGRAGPDDAHDGDEEQDGEDHIGADEGGSEDRGQDGKGRRGGVGERGEEADEGPVRAASTRAARQSVQTRARACVSVMRRLPRLACPTGDAACLCRVPWLLLSLSVTRALTRYPHCQGECHELRRRGRHKQLLRASWNEIGGGSGSVADCISVQGCAWLCSRSRTRCSATNFVCSLSPVTD